MDNIAKLNMRIVPITWVLALIVVVLFYFVLPDEIRMQWIKAYALGAVTGLLCFNILSKDTRKNLVLSEDAKANIQKNTIISYLKRLVVAGAVMGCMIYYKENFNIISGLAGYMSVKVVMFFVVMLSSEEDD